MGTFQRINPVTGEVASEAQAMKASDIWRNSSLVWIQ